MSRPLQILLVEDSEDEAQLVLRELRKGGFTPEALRVESEPELIDALQARSWQLVLSDYRLPGFDGMRALELVRKHDTEVPVIMISGTMGEELAVATMKAGAHDYVMKDALARLTPAVERELREADRRREKRRAEDALRKSEEQYRELVENANSIILSLDCQGQVTFINEFAQRFFGFSRDEILGRNLVGTIVAPGEHSGWDFRQLTAELAQEGERPAARERENLRKDGSRVWVSWTNTSIRDDAGNVVGILAAGHDLTERKRAERALQEKARFEAVLLQLIKGGKADSAEAIHHITETVCLTLEIERAAVWHYAEDRKVLQCEDLFLRSRQEHQHGLQLDVGRFPHYFTALNAGRAIAAPHAATDPRTEGFTEAYLKPFDISSMLDAPVWREGQVAGVVCFEQVGTDRDWTPEERDFAVGVADLVTRCWEAADRKRAEEERHNLERHVLHVQKLESLGVLAGGIAHDFNNLLMAILGNADLALQDVTPSSPARGSILEVIKAARRASELARQMLAYSGKGKFILDQVNLAVLAREMAHLLEVSVSKRARLECRLADHLPCFEGDVTQIRQVIMNLITNASDALGDQDGSILLSTGVQNCDRATLDQTIEALRLEREQPLPEGPYVYLEVQDTGCGMDAATQKRIFDPFFTTKFTGRGLGLAAVLGIVRGHRGAITIDSQPGRGTRFRVFFPAQMAPATAAPRRTGDTAQIHKWRGKGTVLIADDEATIRTVAAKMLTRLGFEVLAAADGQEALDLFRLHAERIVCVLLDLTMPQLDGEQTFHEIRRIDPAIKVILCSGYSEQEAVERFVGEGLGGFLQKPYSLGALETVLKGVVAPPEPVPAA